MKQYYSKVFYHRDDVTKWLNDNQSANIVNITWIGDYWILFYFI